jgi:hypothetical protein
MGFRVFGFKTGALRGQSPCRGGSGKEILAKPIFLWSEGETSPLKQAFDFKDFDFDFEFDFKDFKDFGFKYSFSKKS